jgi:hypothetical protein
MPMQRPFAWRITIPADGRRRSTAPCRPHRVVTSTHGQPDDQACRLDALEARHPDPGRLRRALDAVGIGGVIVASTGRDGRSSLVAAIETPGGVRRLGDDS